MEKKNLSRTVTNCGKEKSMKPWEMLSTVEASLVDPEVLRWWLL